MCHRMTNIINRWYRLAFNLCLTISLDIFKFIYFTSYYKCKSTSCPSCTPCPSYPVNDITEIKADKILEKASGIIENENLGKMVDILEEHLDERDYSSLEMAAALLLMNMGEGEFITEDMKTEDFGDTGAEPGMVRLFINIGKKQKVRIGDILGAVAGESGMEGKLVGAIDMYDKYTFVEVPREYASDVIDAMKNAKIKGKSVNVEPANKKD